MSRIRRLAISAPLGLLALVAARADTVMMPTYSPLRVAAGPDAPLSAPKGVTAIAGQVVDENGLGLAGVRVAEGARSTVSGADGRFLIAPAIAGKGVLQIDGRASVRGQIDRGLYQVAVDARPGLTSVLPFKSFLPPIDHSHDVAIETPTRVPIRLTHPALPGVEVRIPAGTVILDADGGPVKHIGLTPFAPGRSPVPYPAELSPNASFTIQPGASCLYDRQGGIGFAQVVLPNLSHLAAGTVVRLFRYEPDTGGWRGFGDGRVTANGAQIMPDPTSVITDFASAECDPKTKSRPAPAQRLRVLAPGEK